MQTCVSWISLKSKKKKNRIEAIEEKKLDLALTLTLFGSIPSDQIFSAAYSQNSIYTFNQSS